MNNRDGEHGLVVGGPLDDTIIKGEELHEYIEAKGFMKGKFMRWHEYQWHERGDGTGLFVYCGSREHLNTKPTPRRKPKGRKP